MRIFFLFLGVLISTIHAATYTVTQSFGCGNGTIVDALHQANANAGKDTIVFASNVTNLTFDCNGDAQDSSPSDYFLLWISESVDIIGHSSTHKVTVDGEILWADSNGYIRPLECPMSPYTGVDITRFPGFIRIGTPSSDNSGIVVNIENMIIQNMNAFAQVYDQATLNTSNSELLSNADSKWCTHSLIDIQNGANVTLDHVSVKHNQFLVEQNQWYADGLAVMSSGATLNITDSYFSDNHGGGAILAQGNLNIISTLFEYSGGIRSFGADVQLVNSALITSVNPEYWKGIYASGGTVNITASTISGTGWTQTAPLDLPAGAAGGSELRFVNGADVTLDSSVVHASLPTSQTLPLVYNDGSATISVTTSHVSDGSLATAESAPPFGIDENAILWPALGDPLSSGALLDRISTPLLNPLTAHIIATDLNGDPRVSGLSRDMGAIELQSVQTPLFAPVGLIIFILSLGVAAMRKLST